MYQWIPGRTYHTEFFPPKIAGIDDFTGEALQQREDDKLHIVEQRLLVYHAQTAPLTAWYKSGEYPGNAKYVKISGSKKRRIYRRRYFKNHSVSNYLGCY